MGLGMSCTMTKCCSSKQVLEEDKFSHCHGQNLRGPKEGACACTIFGEVDNVVGSPPEITLLRFSGSVHMRFMFGQTS